MQVMNFSIELHPWLCDFISSLPYFSTYAVEYYTPMKMSEFVM